MSRRFSPAQMLRNPAGLAAPAATLALAALFVYAGALKMRDPQALADSIDGYRLPLGPLTNPLAIGLPPLEILAGAALLWRRFRGSALLILGALCGVFLVALGQAALRGFTVDCGCFGAEAPSAWGMTRAILRDLAMLAAILWLYRRELNAEPSAITDTDDDGAPEALPEDGAQA